MGNLIKPSDYAKKMGISRQAVYAKIKRGILTSKRVDGKLYVVQGSEKNAAATPDKRASETPNPSGHASATSSGKDLRELLAAKDETIGVLKATITDLKETNQMITSTLRSEVDLLKEAFSEMKMLYSTQIEHMRLEERSSFPQEEPVSSDLVIGADDAEAYEQEMPSEPAFPLDEEEEIVFLNDTEVSGDELAWIELSDFFDENGLRKKEKRKKIHKRLKKLFKKGDSRVDSFNGELVVLADADYSDVLKKKKRKR